MSILTRFKDIMASNINALLDKAEDPVKMVDQLLRNLNDDLGKVKAETAGVMAEEARSRRALDECLEESAKMQNYAEKAVMAGNDGDARAFLKKKADLLETQKALQASYNLASENAKKMREMHDRLVEQISSLNARKDAIKAKMAVARAQEKVNQMGKSLDSSAASLNAFERMEQKADNMLDRANAMAELNAGSKKDDVSELSKKYDEKTAGVEDELAMLKARLTDNK